VHVGRRDLHVDHEVGTRVAEDHQQVVLAKQRGVDHQPAIGPVQDGQGQRRLCEAVDDLAHQVGALVAVEQAGQHLDLEVGARPEAAQFGRHGLHDVVDVAVQVFELHLQLEVVDDARPGLVQVFLGRVVGAVGGRRARRVVSMYSVLTAGRTKMKSFLK
jgi:hypothetical protein